MYKSTNDNLCGRFAVKTHAREQFKKRHGNKYIGSKKIRNMGRHKINKKIINSVKNRRKFINEQDDGSLYVETKDFRCIIVPGFKNHIVTVLPEKEG